MTWELHHHDARRVSELLEPESVDLIVTSPPYFALRSYRDDGEHYDGQLGSEATPGEFIDNLIACTADWLTVLKPGGSLFVNLGDKYAGSGGHNNASLAAPGNKHAKAARSMTGPSGEVIDPHARIREESWTTVNGAGSRSRTDSGSDAATNAQNDSPPNASRRNAPDRYNQASDGIPAKSRMGLPWRYAIRCIDELGLILRADIVWSKVNGLPESVQDRVRMSHEYVFHFTKQGRYFAAIDEVREASDPANAAHSARYNEAAKTYGKTNTDRGDKGAGLFIHNPLGKVPGSVWTLPSEPLQVPAELGVDHFAAFPSELARRCILGWTPSGWCVECGEARRAVVDKQAILHHASPNRVSSFKDASEPLGNQRGVNGGDVFVTSTTITGYACACPTTDAPTTPAVVLDPFAGTGTAPAVAHHLGRHGIGVDLSRDYLRLAEWRCSSDRALRDKVLDRSGIPNPRPPKVAGQLDLFGEAV